MSRSTAQAFVRGRVQEVTKTYTKYTSALFPIHFCSFYCPQSWDPHNRCNGLDAEGRQSHRLPCSTRKVKRRMGPASNGRRNLATYGYLSTLSSSSDCTASNVRMTNGKKAEGSGTGITSYTIPERRQKWRRHHYFRYHPRIWDATKVVNFCDETSCSVAVKHRRLKGTS